MKILLAIDGSPCSDAAVKEVTRRRRKPITVESRFSLGCGSSTMRWIS